MSMPDGHAVGVDFGTSTSLVAQRIGRQPVKVIPIGHSTSWLPSIASHMGGAFSVGEEADTLPPDRMIRSVKMAITENQETVRVGGRDGLTDVPADEVIAAILKETVRRARSRGLPLETQGDLRLGCPAMWTREQRQRVLRLAASVDLPVDHSTLIDEPVAAGVAWLTSQQLISAEPVQGGLLVFDMGGGTLDVAVLDVLGGDPPQVSVLAATGLALAGDALDDAIAEDIRTLLKEQGVDVARLRGSAHAEGALRRLARETKERLSFTSTHRILLPRIFFGSVAPVSYTRDRLEKIFTPQLEQAEQMLWHALRIARLTHVRSGSTQEALRTDPAELAGDIRYVLLAGGMSRIPYIRARIQEMFPAAEFFDRADSEPDEAIVAGLADTVGYERVSMHRPGFDFVLEWDGGRQRHGLYAAYTPLYEAYQLQNGHSNLGREIRIDASALPRQGGGKLRVVSPSGQPVLIKSRGRELDGFEVPFGHHEVVFKLYCDGRINLTDGAGHDHDLRVDGWPVIRGRDSRPEPVPVPDPVVPYPFNRS